ncbi:MAG: aminopeptidase [Vicinamibacterales bacterium]
MDSRLVSARWLTYALSATLVVGALIMRSSSGSAQTQLTLDHSAIARQVVQQLALTPGEKVLSIAHPGMFEGLLPHLRWEVIKAGGIDLGVIDVMPEPVPEGWDVALLQKAERAARQHYKAMLRDVDAAIMMPGATPAHAAYAAMQDWLKEGRGRTVHFHWIENGSAYPLPGQPLPLRPVIDARYQRALLETDYRALAETQEQFATALRGQDVRVTSSSGTDLRFRIGDRPVNRQDGNASAARTNGARILIDREVELPAGVIRVAPLEETIEGTIAFPPSQWDGRSVEGLIVRFAKGRVADVRATTGREAVEAEMTRAGEAGTSFREFALGFNPLLAVPDREPWIPYYGYGAGVVRLSLGDNSELGGTVGGGYVRWNFFTDLTVVVGATEWVKNGKLTVPSRF